MTIAQLIPLAVQVSIAMFVLAVALEARMHDLTYLMRRPGLLLRSLVAMNLVMPALAVGLAVAFDLNPAVEVALLALALSPVPPFLPKKEISTVGEPSYTMALLLAAALFSIVFVPAAVSVLANVFGRPTRVSTATVVKIVATSILLPLLAGVVFAKFAPAAAKRLGKPLSICATVMLVVALLPVLIREWPEVAALIGNYSVLAIAAFSVAGLAVGHAMGGPKPGDRTVLALSTSARHPAMAMAIAHDMPDKRVLLAAVLLAAVVGTIVSIPYVRWRRRASSAAAAPQGSAGRP